MSRRAILIALAWGSLLALALLPVKKRRHGPHYLGRGIPNPVMSPREIRRQREEFERRQSLAPLPPAGRGPDALPLPDSLVE